MANKFIVKHRRGTLQQWQETEIIPYEGELVIEIDKQNNLHKLKIGDGIHKYTELAYLKAGDEIVSQVLTQVLPHVVTITIYEDKWTQTDTGCYCQEIEIENIGDCCRLDLQPDVEMLTELRQLGIIFVTENCNGKVTIYSVGNMPLKTYTMQATLTDTNLDISSDKIFGIPVGASTSVTKWDDIQDKPESLPAEGGNADTVNGHTVQSDVPQNAKFTDTTYGPAGESLGLVKSGGDVIIEDGIITIQDDSHNHTIDNVDGLQNILTDVDTKINSLTNSEELLDTLGEIQRILENDEDLATTLETLSHKVDKVEGKGLSTEDFTTEEKEKLAELKPGEVTGLSIVDGQLCITFEEV